MMKKMTNSCEVLNDILREPKKYEESERKYHKIEENDRMYKMHELYNLCEEFVK